MSHAPDKIKYQCTARDAVYSESIGLSALMESETKEAPECLAGIIE